MRFSSLLGPAIILLFALPLPAETFQIPNMGVSLTVPVGWSHDDTKPSFGYRIVPPADQQNRNKIREIRIHITAEKGTALFDAMEKGILKATETAPKWGASNDRKSFLGSSEVHAKSGMRGLKGSFGEKDEAGSIHYTINKYYFKNAAGKVLCVCAYVFGPEGIANQYEEIILGGLKLSPQ